MPTVRAPVNAELVAVKFLRTALTAAIGANRVSTELPPEPTFPWVTVTRTGGLVEGPGARFDVARLQVDVWGTTKTEARTGAAAALAALIDMPQVQPDGVVSNVEQDVGMRWEPDPETDQPRYLFGVAVYTHP